MLISSKNLFGQNNNISSLKGISDSLVVIDIGTIREASVKLVERNYLKEVCAQQDTIINNQGEIIAEYTKYNSYLVEQNINYRKSIIEQQMLNAELERNLKTRKTLNWVLGGVSTSAIVTTVVLLMYGK